MDTTVAVLYGVLWDDQSSSALCLSLQTVKEHEEAHSLPEAVLVYSFKFFVFKTVPKLHTIKIISEHVMLSIPVYLKRSWGEKKLA